MCSLYFKKKIASEKVARPTTMLLLTATTMLLTATTMTATTIAFAAAAAASPRPSHGTNASGLGPGAGEWKVDTPENHGLSSATLAAAAKEIGARAKERCRRPPPNPHAHHMGYRCAAPSAVLAASRVLSMVLSGAAAGVPLQVLPACGQGRRHRA